MLIFSLKKEWYEKIKNYEKTVEYREVKNYWTKRFYKWCKQQWESINIFDGMVLKFPLTYSDFSSETVGAKFFIDNKGENIYLQYGYKPETRLPATIKMIEIMDGKETDLKIDKPVYAIHFKLVGAKK